MEIEPTFRGFIEDENDALLLFQATVDGKLKHIPRRPYEIERRHLIVSGSVFVFVEEISGIKRWTDGVSWSPSRIAGRFLIYKELDKGSSGHVSKNVGNKTVDGDSGCSVKLPPLLRHSSSHSLLSSTASLSSLSSSSSSSRSSDAAAVKKYTGFTKKTMSVKFKDPRRNRVETLHLVSYYNVDDVNNQRLTRPRDSIFLKNVEPCAELLAAMENTALGNGSRSSFFLSSASSSRSSSTSSSPSLGKITAGSNYATFVKKQHASQTDANILPPQIIPSTNSFSIQQQQQQHYMPFVPLHTNYTSQPPPPVPLPQLNPQPSYLQVNSIYQLQPIGQMQPNCRPGLHSLVFAPQPTGYFQQAPNRDNHSFAGNNGPLSLSNPSGTSHGTRNFFFSSANPPDLR
ncbi:hypothetical protein HG536_0F03060 [Torulaspora globosa]|uniref:Uncharacterized protein n=1 Tax=Torulaspora globosa TaxID=48254 RepID=A0A7G3ZKE5_9SACH|nr:uncharacterized protein HG536_0F03060 [Torulaspora globosa]QLL33981.1 hypothetical protein HG536_0F03060 [Torulaspora globosa]